MKKKVDSRIQTLIENNIKSHERSMFILVGDRSRYQIVNFHYILTRNTMKAKPKVLWCYSKDLGFSSHQKKRMNQIKNLQNKGLYDQNVDNPFDLFVSSTQIRYTFYHESHKILGNTYQMLILQDFQALTPNVLCRTIQTVQGGGLIIFMLKTMDSLKQLYSLTMDVHQRYRTQAFKNIQPRFNERFILSLKQCHSCIFMDDELNILPISQHAKQQLKPINANQALNKKSIQQLQSLKQQLKVKDIIGPLVSTSKTLDQAKVIMSMIDVLIQKNSKTTFSLTAARGRGKSAAIGLGIAAAIKIGYSNIFVTAPSPNNLKTLFDFVVVGLQLLDFKQRMDFQKIYSTNKDYDRAILRINLFKSHTQFIQFVFPNDADKIGHSDLVVIDQAAAIPLPYVKSFFGPHTVLLSSTINGYEGTGRSLSLKLIKQIKQQNRKGKQGNVSFRKFKQVTMTDPIRYALNDQIQKWLSDLLMLSATQATPLKQGIPFPNDCQLYIVNRDALFSYKKVCQKFLHSLMALFISSHYKNSPNDLQLLSDSPSHLIFILVGPLRQNQSGKTQMPDILCAIQVALEGNLSSANITNNTQRGLKPSGDLIPWTIRQQFQDSKFPQLAGARIVRIATHPAHQKQGYGSRALQLLVDFFQKKLISMQDDTQIVNYDFKGQGVSKPLLKKLEQINPPNISYIGTSFGFTTNLVKFWRKNGFQPIYLRQTVNDTTSQHSGIMLKSLHNDSPKLKLQHYVKDFSRRFMNLLPREFKKLSPGLGLQIIQYTNRKKEKASESQKNQIQIISKDHFKYFLSYLDYKRLQSYANNQSDYHLIIDLVSDLTKLYFTGKLGIQNFNYTWQAILLGVGLQHKTIQQVTKQIGDGDNCHVSNSLALFKKALIRFFKISKQIYQQNIQQKMPQQKKLHDESILNNPNKDNQIAEEQIKKIRDIKGNKKGFINYELEDQEIEELQNQQITEGKIVTIQRSLNVARNQGFQNKKKKKVKKG